MEHRLMVQRGDCGGLSVPDGQTRDDPPGHTLGWIPPRVGLRPPRHKRSAAGKPNSGGAESFTDSEYGQGWRSVAWAEADHARQPARAQDSETTQAALFGSTSTPSPLEKFVTSPARTLRL